MYKHKVSQLGPDAWWSYVESSQANGGFGWPFIDREMVYIVRSQMRQGHNGVSEMAPETWLHDVAFLHFVGVTSPHFSWWGMWTYAHFHSCLFATDYNASLPKIFAFCK